MKRPDSVKVNLKLGGAFGALSIEGNWKVDENEKRASWELYVELSTRVATNEIKPFYSDPIEAIGSMHALFEITRELLKKYGPELVGQKRGDELSLAYISIAILNKVLRPFLSKWNIVLRKIENGFSSPNPVVQEGSVLNHAKFYEELKVLQSTLEGYNELLAKACGASMLYTQLVRDRSREE